MYFDDFVKVVRAHSAPNAHLCFHKNRFGPVDIVTILDYGLPRRTLQVHTGHTHWDWYKDSFAMNCTSLNGEIPMKSFIGDFKYAEPGDEEAKWVQRPVRGVRESLMILLRQGVITPGKEIDILLKESSRKYATNTNRLFYRN